MQKKNYKINYGQAVTVMPKSAAKRIVKGEVDLAEIQVLTACIMGNGSAVGIPKICAVTGLDENVVVSALAYWRGAGIVCSDQDEAEASIAPVTEENAVFSIEPETEEREQKVIKSRELPKYTGVELSAMIDKNGGELRDMIDACQQILGYMFSSPEISTVVAMCDYLGLTSDYIMTLCAYLIEKKPGCKVRYLEKTACDLVNSGIENIEALNDYIKGMELYDGVSGKLRLMAGIGAREFTKSENGKINHWIKDLGYGIEMIEAAYEVCCNNTGKFDFKYVDKVLEGWYTSGVKTPAEAEAANERYRTEKTKNEPQKGATSGTLSFDPDEFMRLAVARSKENMAKLK